MKLKNVFGIIMSLVMALTLTACSSGDNTAETTPSKPLAEIMDDLYADIEELPMVGNTELDAENFQYFAFVDYPQDAEALASDALINAVAHSGVLVRVKENAQSIAESMEKNANPNKWVCVGAEKTIVKRKGNLIMLVMSSEATADAIAANFDKLS